MGFFSPPKSTWNQPGSLPAPGQRAAVAEGNAEHEKHPEEQIWVVLGLRSFSKTPTDNGDIPAVKAALWSRGEMPGITPEPRETGHLHNSPIPGELGCTPDTPGKVLPLCPAKVTVNTLLAGRISPSLQPGCPRHSSCTPFPLIPCSCNRRLCWDLSHRQIWPLGVSCIRDGPESSQSWYGITAQRLCTLSSDTRGERKHPRACPKTERD